MAFSHVTDAGTFYIPGAYPQIKVEASAGGLATTGVLMLVGEADAGPDFSEEEDITLNAFGPDQFADVVYKYKSGTLVDAFRGACSAANDPNIPGSFFRAILVKCNKSGRASSTLKTGANVEYAVMHDRSFGKVGNLISKVVTVNTAEVGPTTGSFTFLPPIADTSISLRINGGAAVDVAIEAQTTPLAFVADIPGLEPRVLATGGTDRAVLGTTLAPLPRNLSVVAVGNVITITSTLAFGVGGGQVTIGDTLWIPVGSVIAGTDAGPPAVTNCGAYIVTAKTATTITALKLLDATGLPEAFTAPVNVPTVVTDPPVASAVNTTVQVFAPIALSLAVTDPKDGVGKTLEINELIDAGTPGLLSFLCYKPDRTKVTWISKEAAPKVIVSGTEYTPKVVVSRQLDKLTEELSAGGMVGLNIGYEGELAELTNDGTKINITAVDALANPVSYEFALADYPTIGDLAGYISTLSGFTASPGNAVIGQHSTLTLDQFTDANPLEFSSTHGAGTGRIKQDAYRFYNKIQNDGALVQMSAQAKAGLPAPEGISYFAGGTKGGTTNDNFQAAIDSLEMSRGNFLVPLFSRDAAADVADNLTEPGSTYTIANIHSYCKSHVLKMSTVKKRRNRQTLLSVRDTFANAKEIAANMASFRVTMNYQDVKDVGTGGVVQFQPWMAAVKAASMQAAGFYRAIMRKGINISGALMASGDFNDQNDSNMEDALISGLLPIRRDETGGFYWVSDQTTYGKDANFVFNSLQATYMADVIAITASQRMEKAFVGQSVADISAALALTALETIMDDFLRLRMTAASSDAPGGFKNARIRIQGPVMAVQVEVKLAGAIYFIPITIGISQVTSG